MIKLTQILNELSVNNPAITPEKASKYYWVNIHFADNNEFRGPNSGWQEYIRLCNPYCEKYDIYMYLSNVEDFKKLSQQDRNRFYNKMRQLVLKRTGKEILNELSVNNPANITPEKAHDYYNNNLALELTSSKIWQEYKKLCQPYCEKYNIFQFIGFLIEFKKLSQSELNSFYNQMRQIVRKHAGKEILN